MAIDTSRLLNNIRITASISNEDSRFSDDILLAYAKEELDVTIYPMVISAQEEYFIQTVDVPVPSTNSIPIPSYAYMAKLRDVKGLQGTTEYVIPKLELSQVEKGFGFWIEGRKIKVAEECNIDSLRLVIYAQHNDLVPTTQVGTIASIDTVNNRISLSSIVSELTAGNSVDTIDSSTGEVETRGALIASVASQTLTLSSVENMVVGQKVALTGNTSLLNLPDVIVPLLVQAVANRVYEDIGDSEAWQLGNNKYSTRAKQVLKVLETRVKSKTPVVSRRKPIRRIY